MLLGASGPFENLSIQGKSRPAAKVNNGALVGQFSSDTTVVQEFTRRPALAGVDRAVPDD